MQNMKKILVATTLSLAMSLGVAQSAYALATVVLPDPLAPIDIGPQRYDEGLVYSSALLAQQQKAGWYPGNTSKFDFATGSGALGVITYGHNSPSNPAGFASALEAGTGSGKDQPTFDGTWGLGTAGTVGLLRNLLTVGGVLYQPMFVFDHNEQSTLQVSGRLAVYRGNTQIDSFALDNTLGGGYDRASYITSCPDVNIGATVTPTTDGCNLQLPVGPYSWGTQGSGKPDYFAIIDKFNLYSSKYLASDSFVIEVSLRGMDPGFEELGIAGYRFATRNEVPEPATLAMLGLALAGLGFSRRKKA